MDNEKGQYKTVVVVDFPLVKMPVDYQITIHVNNLIATFGTKIVAKFKQYLNNPEASCSWVIRPLIEYYGIESFRNWFNLIYGWQFEKAG